MKIHLASILAVLIISYSFTARAGTVKIQGASNHAFKSDLRLPLDQGLWEGDRWPGEDSLCGADPKLLQSTQEGLLLPLALDPGARNGCAYGGLRSKNYYGYGTFSAFVKAPVKPGETASFFLINRWSATSWLQKEIDIEFLGKDRHGVQLSVLHFFHGKDTSKGSSKWVPLDFDVGEGFHEWSILWEPKKITWKVDGKEIYSSDFKVPSEPLMLMAGIWAPDPALSWSEAWVGRLDRKVWPTYYFIRSIRFDPL